MLIEEAIKREDWHLDDATNGWVNTVPCFLKSRNKIVNSRIQYVIVNCSVCGIPHLQKKGNQKKWKESYCSGSCRGKAISIHRSGKNHPMYKTGRGISVKGYVRILLPEHHRADSSGRVYEHIVIAEKKYGRKIYATEDVHHKDGDRSNNDPENLEVLSKEKHKLLHRKYKFSDRYLEHAVLIEKKIFITIAKEVGCSVSLIEKRCKKIGLKSNYFADNRNKNYKNKTKVKRRFLRRA